MPWSPRGWDPPPPPPSSTASAPNPAETVWRVGADSAVWDGRAVAGFGLGLNATALNAGLAVAHAPGDPLDAAIWRGQAEAALVAPGVAWVSAPDGTLALTVAGQTTAALDPGLYRLQVGVTAGGVRSLLYDGTIELLEAPGTGMLRVPYVTGRDLLSWYDQLGTLQTIRGGDATFLQQRAEASDEFDRDLVVRYDPRPGFVRTRRATPESVLGHDVPDPTATPPSPAQLSAAVRRGGVIVDRNVREMVSKMAIARVLDRQEVSGASNQYRQHAAALRAAADALWSTFDIQVDTSNPLDGTADLLVGRDVILLPPGTAP